MVGNDSQLRMTFAQPSQYSTDSVDGGDHAVDARVVERCLMTLVDWVNAQVRQDVAHHYARCKGAVGVSCLRYEDKSQVCAYIVFHLPRASCIWVHVLRMSVCIVR